MHGQLAGQVVTAARGPNGIDVADDVGDGHVRRGQLLDEAIVGRQPGQGRLVAALLHEVAAAAAQGPQRVVVDLAAGDDGQGRIEQVGEAAQEPALGLAAQAEQDHVVPRQDRVRDLGDDRFVVAEDAREEGLARFELADQVPAHLLFHVDRLRARLLELSECPRLGHRLLPSPSAIMEQLRRGRAGASPRPAAPPRCNARTSRGCAAGRRGCSSAW